MKIKERKQQITELYLIDEVCERVIHDTVYRYVVDKNTFKKYFPDWNDKKTSKPKLQPKRKKA